MTLETPVGLITVADPMEAAGGWVDRQIMFNPAEDSRDIFERMDDYETHCDALCATPTLFAEMPGMYELRQWQQQGLITYNALD